jgi:hypothetical protein
MGTIQRLSLSSSQLAVMTGDEVKNHPPGKL